jgi:Fur family ferric uptake transcriptional regulator
MRREDNAHRGKIWVGFDAAAPGPYNYLHICAGNQMDNHVSLIDHLRAGGHRLTPQRRLVLEALQESDRHVSAEEIGRAIEARYPSLSVDHTTIYRTLRWLRDVGLVSETSLGQNHMVYALLSRHHHHHLVCEGCGAVIEAPSDLLEPLRHELAQRFRFAARLSHLSIFGFCEHCQAL